MSRRTGRPEAEMERLRGADEARLRALGERMAKRRLSWYERNEARLGPALEGFDRVERGYRLLLMKLGISEEQAPVVFRDRSRIVFHSKNFCPTLEACRTLGLDTRTVCRLYSERATDLLLKRLDPGLRFERNYEKIRPHGECCEEMVLLDRGDG